MSSQVTQWAGIVDIAVTTDHAFFFNSPTTAYVLPRRAFAHAEDFHDFIDLADDYLARARHREQRQRVRS
jgi:hypothetical protein